VSGLAGIYHLDGRPVDRAALCPMLDALAHRGPDGGGQWIDGAVALGHRLLGTTPQSLGEPQPFVDQAAQQCITLDGRVDNREVLLRALGRGGERCRGGGDAELVLRAYQQWAEGCLGRIVGDYAFVLWDGRRGRLFCARDPLGMKPFYYYHDGRVFLWGSELRSILLDAAVPNQPNEGMIAEYLACAITNKRRSTRASIACRPPTTCWWAPVSFASSVTGAWTRASRFATAATPSTRSIFGRSWRKRSAAGCPAGGRWART
jgi:asparagine synthase (glutamine-hydrolysing)